MTMFAALVRRERARALRRAGGCRTRAPVGLDEDDDGPAAPARGPTPLPWRAP